VLTRRQQLLALAIFCAAVGLRLFATSGETIHDWDEAYHALVGKHFAAHPLLPTLYDDEALPHDDTAWTRARIFLHKPPLAMWLMAGSIKAIGPTVFAMRLPSAVLDLLGVLLTLSIGLRLFGSKIALVAMALHALHGNALLWVGGVHATDHPDIQLAFWVELGIYGVVRLQKGSPRWWLLVGAATGAALLTKSAPGALPLLMLAAFGGKGWKENLQAAAASAALAIGIAAPWNLYARAHWPAVAAQESHAQLAHLWQVFEDHPGHPFFHFEKLGEMHGYLAAIAVAWFLYTAVKGSDAATRMVALWWVAPVLLFSLSATKMPGYMGLAAPAVFLMFAVFAVTAIDRHPPWVKILASAVILSALWGDARELRRLGISRPEMTAFAATMRGLPERTIVLGVRQPVPAMFHGAHAAYPDYWTVEQVQSVVVKGYVVRTCQELGLAPALCADR